MVDSSRDESGSSLYSWNAPLLFFFLVLFPMFVVFGCATGPGPSRILVDDPYVLVKLDVSQSGGNRDYNHPGNISPAQLKTFLESFTLQSSPTLLGTVLGEKSDTPHRAFSESFVKTLVSPLIKGLGRATPLEEVVFFFQESRTPLPDEVTSGSVYVQEGKLHLVLANYKYVTAKGHDIRRLRHEPRLMFSEPYHKIVPGEGVIPVNSASLKHLLLSDPQHFMVDQQALLSRSPRPNSSSAEIEIQAERNSEERLRQIEILHEKGLISHEEFQAKRQEILDSL